MKTETKLRHWLHVLLMLLTFGAWGLVYLFMLALNEMNNRVVRGYNDGFRHGRAAYAYQLEQEGAQRFVDPGFNLGGHCTKAPDGWVCTRGIDHEGPCAAIPK